MRTPWILATATVWLPVTAVLGQQIEERPWVIMGPTVGFAVNSPEGFSNNGCRHGSAVVRFGMDVPIASRVFASGGISAQAALDEKCDVQLVDRPPPWEGERVTHTPEETGLGYASVDLRVGGDWLVAEGLPLLRTSGGVSWIPNKGVIGFLASGESHARVGGSRTSFVLVVDVHFLRVPYRINRREYQNGVIIEDHVGHSRKWGITPSFQVGFKRGFGNH